MSQINAGFESRPLTGRMDQRAPVPGPLFLVDDDLDVLAALKFTFEADGCNVVTLTSGEALIAAAPPRGACIVIDQRLPGMTGLETVAQLRAAGITTPAILITTHPSAAVTRRAAQLDVDIVEKPLLGDALTNKVTAIFAAN
ncbi:MAG: response regulator [Terricaulis sp.]